MDTPAQEFACSLEGSELLARIQRWQEVTKRATSRRIEDNRILATYPNDTQLLRQLRELMDAEAACCSFLEFSLDEKSDRIVTELRFPDDMPAPMLALILDLIGGDR
jgi:hypothetical protein